MKKKARNENNNEGLLMQPRDESLFIFTRKSRGKQIECMKE
jgi:hypothetical protein